MRLKGKVALITGGGTGIGKACAQRFSAEGAKVALMGRRKDLIDQAASEIQGLSLVGDASKTEDMRTALNVITRQYGGLDILVANAGGLGGGSATETTDESWAACVQVNITSTLVSARESLPLLIDRKGVIIVMSSISGLTAAPDVCGYTTAKHALIGLTRSLARDYGPRGVRANVVCPGWVRTPMGDTELQVLADQRGVSLDEAYAVATADVPLRRAAMPEEIASVCVFLASDESSIITGAVLVADGGSSIVDVPTLPFTHTH